MYSQIISAKLNYYLNDHGNYLFLTPVKYDNTLQVTCSYETHFKHTFDDIIFLTPVFKGNNKIKRHRVPFLLSVNSQKFLSVISSSISKEIYDANNYDNSELGRHLNNLLRLNKFDILKDILATTPGDLKLFGRLENQYLNHIKLNIKKGLLLPKTKSILELNHKDNISSILVEIDSHHHFAFIYNADSEEMYQMVFYGLSRHLVECLLMSVR